MKAVTIAGILIVALWIVWATKEMMDIKAIALEACDIATGEKTDYHGKMPWPVSCPNFSLHDARWINGQKSKGLT